MGKRSNFRRRKADAYQTVDPNAVRALRPHLFGIDTFAEPCCGEGHLVNELEAIGLSCCSASDITSGVDALKTTSFGFPDAIITNPPWTRQILHPMIMHFMHCAPQVWLLFDSDWAYTAQAYPYLDQCTDIVAVGRLRWFNNTTGKDNASWYRFVGSHAGGPHFHGRLRNGRPSQIHQAGRAGDGVHQAA